VLDSWVKANPIDSDQIMGAKLSSVSIEHRWIDVVLAKACGWGEPEGS
jgi:hypothetical protein